MFSRSILAVSAYVALASAAALDVFVPHITSPTSATVWNSFSTQQVTWDTSDAPAQISNHGTLVLHNGATTVGTLADNFDLRTGSISFHVPGGLSGNNFTVVLFGDSGNVSPAFTIVE